MENQILLEKIGDTKTKNLIDECYKIYKENFVKLFPEYFEKNHTKMSSLVTVTKDNEIKSIGMSKVDDLLLDNWGKFFNSFIGGFGGTISMQIIGNQFRDVKMWGSSSTWNTTNGGANGSSIKVGTGTTPAVRQNFSIESGSLNLTSGNGGYNSGLGKVDIPANIVSTSSFSLSETGLHGVWIHSPAPIIGEFMISRDNISPVVSVIVGQTINVDYSLILS